MRKYGCDLAYTPMIIAESFVLSAKARDVEFTTNEGTYISTCSSIYINFVGYYLATKVLYWKTSNYG